MNSVLNQKRKPNGRQTRNKKQRRRNKKKMALIKTPTEPPLEMETRVVWKRSK
jgi:hypothetical protein